MEIKELDQYIFKRNVSNGGTNDEKPHFTLGCDDNNSDESGSESNEEIQPNNCQINCQINGFENSEKSPIEKQAVRGIKVLLDLFETEDGIKQMTDEEVGYLVKKGYIALQKLEYIVGEEEKGVSIRRLVIEDKAQKSGVMKGIPFEKYEYKTVFGACCENVIGYLPIPLGVAGPLLLNGEEYYVPMATTEGCLIASTNRGCRAIYMSGGIRSSVLTDGMTRGPVIHFTTAMRATQAFKWLKIDENFDRLKKVFDSTSRFARLQSIFPKVVGRYLFLRFVSSTGDAMGMNMLSKATELALNELSSVFKDIEMVCLSGNFCTDKKSSAVNWIEGRGKSVVCEAVITRDVVRKILKTSVEALVAMNISKNLIGSAIAGSVGGNNVHASNIVTAIFIACGQDPAQNIASSSCMTLMEKQGENLHISCSMPSIEVGTIGGGTILTAQNSCLKLLGVEGCSENEPGTNSSKLATIVCGTVLSAEISAMSALAAGHLVASHMKHNRSKINFSTLQE